MSILTHSSTDELTIGTVAAAVGVSVDAVRLYERHGLLPQVRRTTGDHRRYDQETVDRLHLIQAGRRLGLGLGRIGGLLTALDHRSDAPVEHLQQLLAERLRDVDEELGRLTRLRGVLTEALHGMNNGECPVTAAANPIHALADCRTTGHGGSDE